MVGVCSIPPVVYNLSAVEYGTQCYCGIRVLSPSAVVPLSDCSAMMCPGNNSQSCGDSDRMLVHAYTCTGNVSRTPRFHGCLTPRSAAFPYCDINLTYAQRIAWLIGNLTIDEKIAILAPNPALGDACAGHNAGVPRLDIPDWSWLTETNSQVSAGCIIDGVCPTTFVGNLGMAASFNRTNWLRKGQVMGTEMRAFNNMRWHRGSATDYVTLTGFGPNINILRDPRFGRISELPGEDPYLNGHFAASMVSGMQQRDNRGRLQMLAYLKHFTA